MQTVNYYDVLGVSPTADDFVIKAAYKALAQRYHPDKFHGNAKDAADAEVKMRQLNEAYQVLSDPAKRREYNASFQQGAQQNQQSGQQKSEQTKQQADWAIALRFYPDLTELETRLGKIDPSLISEFRSSILDSQQYVLGQRVASQLEQNYLENYFGNDPLIVDFARELLLAGKRDGAKELNRMVKVVGGGVSSAKIIEQIEAEYLPQRKADREERERIRKEEVAAERARIKQRAEKMAKEDAAFNKKLFKYFLIAGIALAPVIYFVQQEQAEKNRLEAERVAEERRQTEMRLEEERRQTKLIEAQRYRDNQDGTVTDTQTKLIWKRCSEGQNWTGSTCTGEAKKYDWNDATLLTSSFASKTDWRLPSIQELNTLVYCSNGKVRKFKENGYDTVEHEGYRSCGSDILGEYHKPTINTQAFPATPEAFFWSSSPNAYYSYHTWGVYFNNGGDNSGSRFNGQIDHVRLVRGGQ